MTDIEILDDFAGPGGWDIAARLAGLADPVGVENSKPACATRAAAGLRTFSDTPVDMRDVDEASFGELDGYIASPPCQPFSRLGKGEGRDVLGELQAFIAAVGGGGWVDPPSSLDVRSSLVLYPLRRIVRLRPRWVALEQTPYVLPVWEAYAETLQRFGYHVWTGKLLAANYGVPQLRERSVLLANRDRDVAPPEATHAKPNAQATWFDPMPWVTMGEALGWTDADKWWHARHHNQSGYDADLDWPLRRPSSVIAGRLVSTDPGANANRFNGATKSRNDGYKITVDEASLLQTFPSDYPWHGNQGEIAQQIGNAVPPVFGAALLTAVAR